MLVENSKLACTLWKLSYIYILTWSDTHTVLCPSSGRASNALVHLHPTGASLGEGNITVAAVTVMGAVVTVVVAVMLVVVARTCPSSPPPPFHSKTGSGLCAQLWLIEWNWVACFNVIVKAGDVLMGRWKEGRGRGVIHLLGGGGYGDDACFRSMTRMKWEIVGSTVDKT